MKRVTEFLKNHRVLISLMLLVLAVATGGACFAEATIGSEGATPKASSDAGDPVDPDAGTGQTPENDPNGRLTPSDKTAGQNLDGTQMSSTQKRKGGLEDEEIDSEVTKFQPWNTPLLRIAREVSNKVSIQNWSIEHYRIGGETLDGFTTKKITAEVDGTIKLSAANFRGSLNPFYKDSTILVPSVQGYAMDATTTNMKKEGGLMLIVLSNTNGVVTCAAVNGIPTEEVATYELDSKKCPEIPANTYMCVGATLMCESQMMLPPENFQPRKEKFYVQKKGFNLLWTKDFEQTKSKTPLRVVDVKADAITKYNMRCNRTYWAGVQCVFPKKNDDGSIEDAFGSKGILWQLTNLYTYERGNMKLSDLIAMAKMQFTVFSQSNSAYVFCGKDAIEDLLNIKIEDTEKYIKFEDTKKFDLDFTTFKCTFGTFNFVYDPGLDMLGYKDAMVVLDLKGARRYVKIGMKEGTNDLSKGSGEIREAKRYYRYEADGIALRGYNSILVVPNDKILANNIEAQMRSKVISSATLPTKPLNNDIYALTADFVIGDVTYEKGHAYKATVSGESVTWNEFTGFTSVIL